MDGQRAAATLGVGPRATRDEIRRAFRARAKVLHPDAGRAGSMERFIVLRQAFERLMADAPARAIGGATFETGAPVPPGGTIDLTDVIRPRLHLHPRRAAEARPAAERRDARGLSFADHLSAALARS